MFTGCPCDLTSTMVLRGGTEQFILESERSVHDSLMQGEEPELEVTNWYVEYMSKLHRIILPVIIKIPVWLKIPVRLH